MMARLGDICKFQSGGTPSKSNPSYFGGTIPWITTVALNGNIIDENNAVDWITEKAIAESAAKIVPAKSIMVGTRVGIGKVAINSVPMSTSQDIISLLEIDESRWNKAFICKWLSAKSEYLQSKARGATIKGIKIETISDLEIPEIPIENQQFISVCLDRVSQLISLRKQQLAKLDELVKARFVEMFGDPIKNERKWEQVALEKICDVGSSKRIFEKEYVTEGIPFYRTKEIVELSKGHEISTELFISESRFKEIRDSYGVPRKDDLLVSAVGTIGVIWIVDRTRDFYFKDGNLLRIAASSKFDSVYMKYLLENLIDNYKKKMSAGTAYAALTIANLKNMVICNVPLNLQKQFSRFYKESNRQKLTIQQSLDTLEVLRKSLMQEYFG